MLRTKYVIAVAAALALAMLSVKAVTVAGDAGQKGKVANEAWDDSGAVPGGPEGQLAQHGPEGFRPPRDDDDRQPPPPPQDRGQGRGPQADRGPSQGHGPEADRGPRPQRDGRDGGRDGRGPDGRKGGEGCPMTPPAGGMGPMHDGHPPMIGMPGLPFPHEGFASLEKKDPELFALIKKDMEFERQTRELAKQYRDASEADQPKVKEQIAEVVGKHFDIRQQRRALELKRLEQELQRLRDTMDHRSKARKEIVERRVSELTGHGDELGF